MIYTELGWMTDDELIRYAANKPELTALETELATRFCEVLDELGEIDSDDGDAMCVDAAEYGLVGNS